MGVGGRTNGLRTQSFFCNARIQTFDKESQHIFEHMNIARIINNFRAFFYKRTNPMNAKTKINKFWKHGHPEDSEIKSGIYFTNARIQWMQTWMHIIFPKFLNPLAQKTTMLFCPKFLNPPGQKQHSGFFVRNFKIPWPNKPQWFFCPMRWILPKKPVRWNLLIQH